MFKGARYDAEEELTPLHQSDVILDWMHAIGGPTFIEHIFLISAEELASETLQHKTKDIRQR